MDLTKDNEKVFVLDDDRMVRFHLSHLLTEAGYAVQTFGAGEELLALDPPTFSVCLLLDVQMPGMDGPAVFRQLQSRGWLISVIFVTSYATVPLAVRVVQAGALDVLTKPVASADLLPAVDKALARSRELLQSQGERSEICRRTEQLTRREREVFSFVITGKLNKEIALQLKITERTVKAHRASVMDKLGANSVVDLVRIADRVGVEPAAD